MKFSTKNFNKTARKILSLTVLFAFLANSVLPAYAQSAFVLPLPGEMVHLSPAYAPALLKAVKVNPDNPFAFNFIVDTGSSPLRDEDLKKESNKLIRYFLASLTTPENDLWVNLSPYEKDRIVPNSFGVTEMGRDLLAQDYLLKQITATLMYPEEDLGKKFWDKVYQKAYEKFGTTNIMANTFNKVWIVPEKAVVYENGMTAFVSETKLKVMLEEDYKNMSSPQSLSGDPQSKNGFPLKASGNDSGVGKDVNNIGSQVLREIIIPALEKEVNEGKNFASLRQIYNSLTLANWYKKRLKDSILAKIYVGKNKVTGVDIDDKAQAQKIYEQYLAAFKKGVYNYIKEDVDPVSKEPTPRKYFSGGMGFMASSSLTDYRQGIPAEARAASSSLLEVDAKFDLSQRDGTRIAAVKENGAEKPKAGSSSVKTHVMVNLGPEYVLDFFLSHDMVEAISATNQSPQVFMDNVIEAIHANRSLFSLALRLGREFRRDPTAAGSDQVNFPVEITPVLPKEVATHLPTETYLKLIILQTISQIARYQTAKEMQSGQTPTYKIDEMYGRYFKPTEVLEIVKAILLSQGNIPAEIEQMILNGQIKFNYKDVEAFYENFLVSGYEKKMSLKDHVRLFKILIALENSKPQALMQYSTMRDLQDYLQQTIDKEKQVNTKIEEFQSMITAAVYSPDSLPWEKLIAKLEEAIQLDPNNLWLQDKLRKLQSASQELQQKSDQYLELQAQARQKVATMPRNIVMGEMIRELQDPNVDPRAAFALFEALLEVPEGLSLSYMAMMIPLLPKFGLHRFSSAQKLNTDLIQRLRRGIVDEVIGSGHVFTSERIPLARDVFLMSYDDSPEQRAARLKKAFPDIEDAVLKEEQAEFELWIRRFNDTAFTFHAKYVQAQLTGEEFTPDLFELGLNNGPQYQDFESALKGVEGSEPVLLRAREYFLAAYGIDLELKWDEETPLVDRPVSVGFKKLARLYGRDEVDRVVERLKVVDQALARLPLNMTRNNLSVQKFMLFKEFRAYAGHSELLNENRVALDLESPDLVQTLYHELGHTLHGPALVNNNFASYVDFRRINEFVQKHPELDLPPNLTENSDIQRLVWFLIGKIFHDQQDKWIKYNASLGITDLNDLSQVKKRTQAQVDEFYKIQGPPQFNIPYMFEAPAMDANGGSLVRTTPEEFIAVNTEAYLLGHDFDPTMKDLLQAIIGTTEPVTEALSVAVASSALTGQGRLSNILIAIGAAVALSGPAQTVAAPGDTVVAQATAKPAASAKAKKAPVKQDAVTADIEAAKAELKLITTKYTKKEDAPQLRKELEELIAGVDEFMDLQKDNSLATASMQFVRDDIVDSLAAIIMSDYKDIFTAFNRQDTASFPQALKKLFDIRKRIDELAKNDEVRAMLKKPPKEGPIFDLAGVNTKIDNNISALQQEMVRVYANDPKIAAIDAEGLKYELAKNYPAAVEAYQKKEAEVRRVLKELEAQGVQSLYLQGLHENLSEAIDYGNRVKLTILVADFGKAKAETNAEAFSQKMKTIRDAAEGILKTTSRSNGGVKSGAEQLMKAAEAALTAGPGNAAGINVSTVVGQVNFQKEEVGGINLSADKTSLEIKGNGQPIQFNFDVNQLQNLQFEGLVPSIINISPVVDLPLFLSENTAPAFGPQLSKVN